MENIAALYTCHNRKKKTLASLHSLKKAYKDYEYRFNLEIYLTDDGSTDGTGKEVQALFPEVHIINGDGNLFWAEGMRKSWQMAQEKKYDAYLLLNDDVELYMNVFDQLLSSHEYCIKNYNKSGIYIGATEDPTNNKLTYSGSIIVNKLMYTQKRLPPNGAYQKCDLANANIMLVHSEVVEKIGILSTGYSHGMADYDYTLTANKNDIPVLVVPEYCGNCRNDHKDVYADFAKKTLKERKAILYSPTGLAFNSYLYYMKKFFPYRWPFVIMFGWIKLYFPWFYINFFSKHKRNSLLN